jgi:hypothetical protein
MNRNLEYAAYPTLGEALRFFIGAFDLRARGDMEKTTRLDRAAREGDFDIGLFDELIDSLVRKPMKDQGDVEFGEFLARFALDYKELYLKMVGKLSVDALTRQQLMPILVRHIFPPDAAAFLRRAFENGFSPPPEFLLADPLALGEKPSRVNPILVALETYLWAHRPPSDDVLEEFQPRKDDPDRRKRAAAQDWLSGQHVPDMSTLLEFVSAAANPRIFNQWKRPTSKDLRRSLRVARALEYCLDNVPDRSGFATDVRTYLPPDMPGYDVGPIIYQAVKAKSTRWQISEIGLLAHHALSFDEERDAEAIVSATALCKQFEQEAAKVQAPWAIDWMLRWCQARLAIWQGNWNEGLDLYQEAFKKALYRAGPQARLILREALAIAAVENRRPHVKQYVRHANVLGLWPGILRNADPTADDAPQLAKILKLRYFPYLPERQRTVI